MLAHPYLRRWALGLVAMLSPDAIAAQVAAPDTAVRVSVGAFVDGYYAWDFGRPPELDRSFAGGAPFTTQPARHNEFNVNLAFLEVKLEGARVRGRLALQTGTSVQSNYAGEPAIGQTSGNGLSRQMQEAVAGVKLRDDVWVDAGIFFSHVGMEGWISRDNPTYTRSLVAEYSPYYQAGTKVTWTVRPGMVAQLHVVNGWQNVSENNAGKGSGVRLDYAPASSTIVSYYNFFSSEAGNRLRTFNGVGTKYHGPRWTLLGQADVGTQARSAPDGTTAGWYGLTGIVRATLSPAVAVSGRVERFDDADQVMVGTGWNPGGAPNGPLRANGASIGLDVVPAARALWRVEMRGLSNDTAVFPDASGKAPSKTNVSMVVSLALTM